MTTVRSTSTTRTTTRQRRLLDDLVALSAEIQERRRETDALVARRHREYQRLYDAGIPVGMIAREIGVTPWAVRQHLRPVVRIAAEGRAADAGPEGPSEVGAAL